MTDFEQMTDAQLSAARDGAQSAVEEAQAFHDQLVEEDHSIGALLSKQAHFDEVSGRAIDHEYLRRQSAITEARGGVADRTFELQEVEAAIAKRPAFDPPAAEASAFDPTTPLPAASAAPVESVVADLGRGPVRPAVESVVADVAPGPDRRVLAAAAAAVVVVLVVIAALALRPGSGNPAPASTTATATRSAPAGSAPSAAAVQPPSTTSTAGALHSEGAIAPVGAGCDRQGSAHFLWRVRDASAGDAVVVTLTGPGMPASVDVSMPANLQPVADVPIPLHTSGTWTARISSIAGKATNASPAWEATTSLHC